jgi:hypothetical protein
MTVVCVCSARCLQVRTGSDRSLEHAESGCPELLTDADEKPAAKETSVAASASESAGLRRDLSIMPAFPE